MLLGDDRRGHRATCRRCVALNKSGLYKSAMMARTLAIALIASGLVGCGIGRVVTAPVRYVFHEPESSPATNTSDVTNPGRPVAVPSPTATPRPASRKSGSTSAASRVAASKHLPRAAASAAQFPVAKPVPGKPGLVKSPYAPDQGIVDTRGFSRGQEVKDPYTGKIFLVP